MDARMCVFALAVVLSFAFAVGCTKCALAARRRKEAAIALQESGSGSTGLIRWRLKVGYGVFKPAARAIMLFGKASSFVDEAVAVLKIRGVESDPESLVSVAMAATAVLAVAAGLLSKSVFASLAVSVCVIVASVLAVGREREKNREAARDAVPAALESMASCFGSGFTLQQTFRQVANDIEGPLSATFMRSARILEMGGGSERALKELWHGSHATELAFVAVALDVQHQSGGSMRQVLEAASETVKGELALRRSLRVQTAQAQLSARVVALMPLVLVSIFSLISPDYLAPFFQSVQGYALLSLAVLMQVGGIVLVRKTLEVEGVS